MEDPEYIFEASSRDTSGKIKRYLVSAGAKDDEGLRAKGLSGKWINMVRKKLKEAYPANKDLILNPKL